MNEQEAVEKSIRYYRRWTLGLIPVTIFLEDKVLNRAKSYIIYSKLKDNSHKEIKQHGTK